jgi:hypothetical protein
VTFAKIARNVEGTPNSSLFNKFIFIPFRLPKIRHFKAIKKGLKFSPCITLTFPLKPRKAALKQAQ